jgi:hypothetical protein
MTVTVNLRSKDQEKALLDFLDQMNFEHQSNDHDLRLTEDRKQEIIRRDSDFISGKTVARDWNDIKRDLDTIYG